MTWLRNLCTIVKDNSHTASTSLDFLLFVNSVASTRASAAAGNCSKLEKIQIGRGRVAATGSN